VINLDKKNRNGSSAPLLHFLSDTIKPWSKRWDFVLFHRLKERIDVRCFEFKSASLPEAIVDQLDSGEAWCWALHSTIEHYTNDGKRLYFTKFVRSFHSNPASYLDQAGRYLQRDHSIPNYLYQDIDGLALDALDNTNVEIIT
jgi:hypothetical protein